MPTRRTFLTTLAAATPLAQALHSLENLADAQTLPTPKGPAMPNLPNPLDEPSTPSHVGSLFGPISRIKSAAPFASESFSHEKFTAKDHPAWRKKMLAEVFESMHYAPQKADFAAETVERIDRGKFFREKIYFNTTPELRVPAYLLIPKNIPPGGKAPAIIALHDHGGFYRFGKEKLVKLDDENPELTNFKACYANRSIADDLAEQGYVVIVIDLFYWGERRLRLPDDPPTGANESPADVRKFNAARGPLEQLVARTIYTAGFTWAGLIFWDDIRTVDYLLTRPEVDPDRIGCVGLSVGAWRANHLIALDERIKAAVAVCWLTSFNQIQSRHVTNTVGFTKLLPGLYQRLDMPDVISLAAPRPLLNINGSKDGLFPLDTGVKPAYQTLETVYKKINAPDHFKGSLYNSPHEFNADMQTEAWAWLKKHV